MNYFSPQWALLTGLILSIFIQGSAIQSQAKTGSKYLLQLSIILLGASLNFNTVLNQGVYSLLLTLLSILFVFILGYFGKKILKVDSDQGTLITIGTAICGGSAIGALAPVIMADHLAIAVSIGVVFILNAFAIFIFPSIGLFFELSQAEFGLWSALAIHDTSSVVAASSLFGTEALQVATTIKLVRTLWIIPITVFYSVYHQKNQEKKISFPWFILGFIVVSLLFTFTTLPLTYKESMTSLSKMGFSLTLLLIGLSLDFKKLKKIGLRPLLFGVLLWLIVSISSLVLIKWILIPFI